MEFHERLYEVRKRSGMTQNDLAEKLNVSRQAVSRWEMGTAKPDFENLIAISDIFGISIDYLLKGREDVLAATVQPAAEPEAEEDPNAMTLSEKIWLGVIIAFFVMTGVFSLINGDLHSGIWAAIVILVVLAIFVGIICLITVIVREVLKRMR